jgi:PDZ domain-containing protein
VTTPSEPPRSEQKTEAGLDDVIAPDGVIETGTDGPSPYPGRLRRLVSAAPVWLISLILAAVLVAPTGYLVHLPYYSLGPGPSVNVLGLIDVAGGAKTYPSRGKLLITTVSVSVSTVNLWDALVAWVDPNETLVPRSALIPAGLTDRDVDIENRLEMDESKLNAEIAAFRALGFPVTSVPGARVVAVNEGLPAFGHLRAHDVIVSVDGVRVATEQAAVDQLRRHKPGDRVTIGFIRGTKHLSATMKTVASPDKPVHALIGVQLAPAYHLPRDIQIDTQDIVGPSGGLIFALAIYDAFTPADLTGGHIIAATGEMVFDSKGRAIVGIIGGIEEKVRTAASHHADIFLAPAEQAAAARRVAPKSMRVIGVHTLAQALQVLKSLPPLRSAS